MTELRNPGQRLKELREKAGLSVRATATAADLSPSGYAFYEGSFKRPYLPMELVERLAPLFAERGIPAQELLSLAGGPVEGATRTAGRDRMEFIEELQVGRRNFPIYATKRGEGSALLVGTEPVEYIKAPSPLAAVREGYGFYMIGNEMAPRFAHGDILLVHPSKPPRPGEPVVVYLKERMALVRLLVEIEGNVRLARYGDDQVVELDHLSVQEIHLIVGSYFAR